jgi:hypothetical protein
MTTTNSLPRLYACVKIGRSGSNSAAAGSRELFDRTTGFGLRQYDARGTLLSSRGRDPGANRPGARPRSVRARPALEAGDVATRMRCRCFPRMAHRGNRCRRRHRHHAPGRPGRPGPIHRSLPHQPPVLDRSAGDAGRAPAGSPRLGEYIDRLRTEVPPMAGWLARCGVHHRSRRCSVVTVRRSRSR